MERLLKRLLMGLTVASVLSVASAQGRLFGEALTGQVSLVPNFSLNLALAAGAEGLLGPLDARGGLGIVAASGGSLFNLFADLLYPVRFSDFNLGGVSNPKVNLGAGVGLTMISGNNVNLTLFGLRGIGGLELPLQKYFSLLAELQLAVTFPPNGDPQTGLGIALGPRVYF